MPVSFAVHTKSCEAKVTLPPQASADPRVLKLVSADAVGWLWQLVDDAAAAQKESGKEEWWRPYSGELVFKPRFVSDRVVSLLGEEWQDTGGAHPNSGFLAENIDRKTGNPIAWADLFPSTKSGPAMPPAMHRWVHDALIAAKRREMGKDFDAKVAEDFLSDLGKDPPEFTFAKSRDPGRASGLTLHFAPYEVGPYVEGSYEIAMPGSVFADLLAPDWRAVFVAKAP